MRPKNWKVIQLEELNKLVHAKEIPFDVDYFEAGAAAYEAALRVEGVHCQIGELGIRFNTDSDGNAAILLGKRNKGKSGTLVFVPDEVE